MKLGANIDWAPVTEDTSTWEDEHRIPTSQDRHWIDQRVILGVNYP